MNLWHPLKENKVKPNLNDLETIELMKKAKRYPIPEKLLWMPKEGPKFDLNVDSIMHAAYHNDEIEEWAEYKQEIDAPANSMNSNEDLHFASSSEGSLIGEIDIQEPEDLAKVIDEEIVKRMKTKKPKKATGMYEPLPPDTREARAYEDRVRSIKIHKDALELHGFDLEVLESYPHKTREGDVPTFLLKD